MKSRLTKIFITGLAVFRNLDSLMWFMVSKKLDCVYVLRNTITGKMLHIQQRQTLNFLFQGVVKMDAKLVQHIVFLNDTKFQLQHCKYEREKNG